MPIFRFEDQTFTRMIENELFLFCPVVIGNNTASVHTDARLIRFMMTMSSPHGIVDSVNIEGSFYGKRDILFDHCQISPLVRMCRQLQQMGHKYSFVERLVKKFFYGIDMI